MALSGQEKQYLLGHEYDLGDGSTAVWGGQGFVTPEAYMAQKAGRSKQFAHDRANLTNLEEAEPLARQGGTTGFWGSILSGADQPGWSPYHGLAGSPAVDLNEKLKPVRSNAFLQGILQLKAASPTGSTSLGAVSDPEGERLESSNAILSTKQSQGQLIDQMHKARAALIENTPGLDPSNPIELNTINPADMPEGAYWRHPDGTIYRQRKARPAAPAPSASTPAAPLDPRAAMNKKLNDMSAAANQPVEYDIRGLPIRRGR